MKFESFNWNDNVCCLGMRLSNYALCAINFVLTADPFRLECFIWKMTPSKKVRQKSTFDKIDVKHLQHSKETALFRFVALIVGLTHFFNAFKCTFKYNELSYFIVYYIAFFRLT